MDESISEVQPQEGGGNPAWNDFLSAVPPEYHEKVTPVLKRWDEGVNQKLQSVQQRYAGYDAYEPFITGGVSPEDLQYGYGILKALQNDPVNTVKAIHEAFNITPDVFGQGQEELNPQDEIDPRYANLHPDVVAQLQRQQETLETMGKLLLKQREDALAAAEGEKLDAQLTALKRQYGDFDEAHVLRLALQMDNNVEEAVKYYNASIQNALAKRNVPQAPRLLGSGGGAPENSIDPRKLDRNQTIKLMTDMLKASQGANKAF